MGAISTPFSRDRLKNGPVTLDSGQREGKQVSGKVLVLDRATGSWFSLLHSM